MGKLAKAPPGKKVGKAAPAKPPAKPPPMLKRPAAVMDAHVGNATDADVDGGGGEDEGLRNRVKSRRWEALWNSVPGTAEHSKFQPVKEKVLQLKDELKGSGKWTKEQSNIINKFFQKGTLGRWEPQYNHPMFTERRFRVEKVFDRDWHEGELREVVEGRMNPTVLENLIQQKKVKYDGLMVFLPRQTVGVDKNWVKSDEGSRSKELGDQQFTELAGGIDQCIEAKSNLEIANHSSGSHGTSSVGIGAASNIRCTVFNSVIAQKEKNLQVYLGVKEVFEPELIALEKILKVVEKISEKAFDEHASNESDLHTDNLSKLMALQEDAQVLQSDCEWVHKFKKNKTGEPLDGEAMGAMVKELQH